MTDDEKGGKRPNTVVIGAIVLAALIVVAMWMWTSEKVEEVDESIEAREAAAAAQP